MKGLGACKKPKKPGGGSILVLLKNWWKMKGIFMSSKYFTERNVYAFAALALLALLLTACGGSHSTTATLGNSLSHNVTSTPVGGTSAMATLKHQPQGSASLTWDHTSHMLSVQIMLTGLAPGSIHPVHIDQGSCSNKSGEHDKTLYPLVNLSADTHGVANATSKVSVPDGIPASGWYVDVHNGPGLSNSDQAMSIACGDVVNHDTSLRSSQVVQAMLQPTAAANQNVSGEASLTLSGHTLKVELTLSGLAPKSEHMAHIHAGTCASQGSVIYPLTPIKADASGKASVTTTIQNVTTIPAQGWYINVHDSTDISTQTGFDPIACGDVMLNKA